MHDGTKIMQDLERFMQDSLQDAMHNPFPIAFFLNAISMETVHCLVLLSYLLLSDSVAADGSTISRSAIPLIICVSRQPCLYDLHDTTID